MMVALETQRSSDAVSRQGTASYSEFEGANENGISLFGALVLPEMSAWRPILDRLGVSIATSLRLASSAGYCGSSFQAELLASGVVSETAFYQAMAADLGVDYEDEPDPQKLVLRQSDGLMLLRRGGNRMAAQIEDGQGGLVHLVTPDLAAWLRLRRCFDEKPALRQRIRIVSPSVLRQAILWRSRKTLTRLALTSLYEQRPDCSARNVVSGYQAFTLGLLVAAIPVLMLLAPKGALTGLHVFLSLFFFACVALRVAAIFWLPPPRARLPSPAASRDMPVYSVLVALDNEAEIVPDLLGALGKINWPASKLEIKLVCEEDDVDTIHAIMRQSPGSHIEIIVVPDTQPRTKPKALSYALPLTSGEFVVLYDAEDRPHPMQLMEAWQRFCQAGPELGCLQAPLEVSNRGASLISNMFGFEYASLFRRLLPWLAANHLMFPLGGTSNHFRRSVLEEVGDWDPYNVTEDADLGLRLARFGYRAETIFCPTHEEGPEDFKTWRRQRMRWFKGWMQTWLVHMRAPVRLSSELPLVSLCLVQVLFAGMLLSALSHPFLLLSALFLVVQIKAGAPLGEWQIALLVFDTVNIALGYLSFMILGWLALRRRERKGYWKVCLFLPVYWMMLSIAAWCALHELCQRPHHWNKTPHRRRTP
jgi:cellulose synthase/poly-beta-1,6-N-acetylglucosamine synthase-like glycosyltransferase